MSDFNFEKELLSSVDLLVPFAISRTRNRDTAEDLVQDTLCMALRYKHLFEPHTNLHAWLITIMKNVHWKQLRYSNRRSGISIDFEEAGAENIRGVTDVEAQVAAGEIVGKLLTEIPNTFSQPLIMFAQGASGEEIAEELCINKNTVRTRINRARSMLQENMQ